MKKTRPLSESKQLLTQIREALLTLHKALIDGERERYESAIGPIKSPNQFLGLLTNDPWFTWLQPFSQLIVAMDELMEEKEPLTTAGVEALVRQAQTLLVPEEQTEGFSGHYFVAMQANPDVVLAHAAAMKLIGRKK